MACRCRDCGVLPGQVHVPGCDIALCKLCGFQDIGDHDTDCPEDDDRPSTVWTGRYPGLLEVEEWGLRDLNELASLQRTTLLRWDRDLERWVKDLNARQDWDQTLARARKWEDDRRGARVRRPGVSSPGAWP